MSIRAVSNPVSGHFTVAENLFFFQKVPLTLIRICGVLHQSDGGANGVMKLPGRVMAGGVVPAGGFRF